MKLALIISRFDPETIWNVLRLANFSIETGDEVALFLLGQGVEYGKADSPKFNILELAKKFVASPNGKIMACGTCLKSRDQKSNELCPVSTLKDLHSLIKNYDNILTF